MGDVSSNNEKWTLLLEEQLAHANQQNRDLSKKLDQANKQIEALTEQVRQLNKLLFGSKTEKS